MAPEASNRATAIRFLGPLGGSGKAACAGFALSVAQRADPGAIMPRTNSMGNRSSIRRIVGVLLINHYYLFIAFFAFGIADEPTQTFDDAVQLYVLAAKALGFNDDGLEWIGLIQRVPLSQEISLDAETDKRSGVLGEKPAE
jgi:hypothetical protein